MVFVRILEMNLQYMVGLVVEFGRMKLFIVQEGLLPNTLLWGRLSIAWERQDQQSKHAPVETPVRTGVFFLFYFFLTF